METTDPTGITKKVQLLEAIAHGLSEAYRLDLETELGGSASFTIQKLSCYDWANAPEDHFYRLMYGEDNFGIILPISKQALIGSESEATNSVFQSASEVLNRRGYSVIFEVDDTYNLIEIAQQKRKGKNS